MKAGDVKAGMVLVINSFVPERYLVMQMHEDNHADLVTHWYGNIHIRYFQLEKHTFRRIA